MKWIVLLTVLAVGAPAFGYHAGATRPVIKDGKGYNPLQMPTRESRKDTEVKATSEIADVPKSDMDKLPASEPAVPAVQVADRPKTEQTLEEKLSGLDQRIASLQDEGAKLTGDVRNAIQDEINELTQKRDGAKTVLGQLRESRDADWRNNRVKAQLTVNALEKDIKRLESKIR